MTGGAKTTKQMIESLDETIATARLLSFDFVVRLLEMARLELLVTSHGIKETELDSFCATLARQQDTPHRRRKLLLGDAGPRRARRPRAKPRKTRRSAPAS
jgi:hypothetical protein